MNNEMKDFWDQDEYYTDVRDLSYIYEYFVQSFASYVKDRNILEIGCGSGTFAYRLTQLGAKNVVAIDFSEKAIHAALTSFGKVKNLSFHCADILEYNHRQEFDLITGTAILHEFSLAEFPALIKFLDNHLAADGIGFFMENSFFNPLFRLIRKRIIGRYGTVKFGSEHEIPLDLPRFQLCKNHFKYCERSADQFVMFERFFLQFLFRYKRLIPFGQLLDTSVTNLFGNCRFTRSWSYLQEIYFSRTIPKISFVSSPQ